MKRFKYLLTVTLAILLILNTAAPAFADTDTGDPQPAEVTGASDLLGDVDGDGEVTILDATAIQCWKADLKELSEDDLLRADANLDGVNEIDDATHIQRFLAVLPGRYYLNQPLADAQNAKALDDANEALTEEERKAEEARLYRQNIEDRIANFTRTKGVDISEHNGDVDMNKLKAAGYSFVIIRLGYGSDYTSQDDAYFERNVKKAEAAGLDWGAYIYSYALNPSQAKSELNHTLRLLKGKKPTMPIAYDMEYDSYKAKYLTDDAILHDICVTYLSGLQKAGYYPMLYAGYSYLNGVLNKPDIVDTYDIWYAQWNTTMQYDKNRVGIWQYGGETNFIESPYIDGLSGAFDKNYCYKNYPLIITAYGYNNHTALIQTGLAPTAASPWDDVEPEAILLPEEYNGVMGGSLRRKRQS